MPQAPEAARQQLLAYFVDEFLGPEVDSGPLVLSYLA